MPDDTTESMAAPTQPLIINCMPHCLSYIVPREPRIPKMLKKYNGYNCYNFYERNYVILKSMTLKSGMNAQFGLETTIEPHDLVY